MSSARFRAMETLVCVCLALGSLHASSVSGKDADPDSPPLLEVGEFSWAENLEFDGAGNLFVSDTEAGAIWRIFLREGAWVKQLFLDGFKSVNGLAAGEGYLYAAVRTTDNVNLITKIDIDRPQDGYVAVGTLEYPGNGLEFGPDGSLYVTTEGLFLPGTGTIYRLSPSGTLAPFVDHLFAPNGIAIDHQAGLMYVTETLNSKVLTISLATARVVGRVSLARTFAHSILDDICLDATGETLYLADFGLGELIALSLEDETTTVIRDDLNAPTSVLLGEGPTFNPDSLYVTEAGGLFANDTDQRVLEIPLELN